MNLKTPFLSVITPVFNEQDNVAHCYKSYCEAFATCGEDIEFIFVDDGSKDDTYNSLLQLAQRDTRVKCIKLARNFGKEAAMTAGFDVCKGRFVTTLDVDLQDPPELVLQMIELAEKENWDVVYGVRQERQGETIWKKTSAFLFYKIMGKMSEIHIPSNTGDFRIMRAPVVEALRQFSETQRFMKGLFSWVGFRQTAFYYVRKPRYSGKSKYNYFRLWNFAMDGITSFSNIPLRFATYVGFLFALVAFFLALFYISKYFIFGDQIQGFLTLIVSILFIGGIQMMFLGIIGEYLGRIYIEAKHRPVYIVQERKNL